MGQCALGTFNLLIAYLLLCRVGTFNLRRTDNVAIAGIGGLLTAVMLAMAFGKVFAGH